MTKPFVSIVVPAYNHARYLAESIRSLLGQDYPAVEVIVLDDGSTDNTQEILSSLEGKFDWETQSNIGQARTLAKGWERARGEVLGYLSADDVLAPTAVTEAVKVLMAESEVVATYSDYFLIDPESRPIRLVSPTDCDFRKMFRNVICSPGPGAFFRRSTYKKTGPWNPNLRQMPDYEFWLRVSRQGSIRRIPKPLACFRVHSRSQTFAPASPEVATEPVSIVSGILSSLPFGSVTQVDVARAKASAHLISAQLHIRAGRLGGGFNSLVEAWRLDKRAVLSIRTALLLLNASINRICHRILWTIRAYLANRPLK